MYGHPRSDGTLRSSQIAPVGAGGSASNRYRLVGEAYVQGIMRGELYNGVDDQDGGLAEETIVLE